MRYFHNSVGIRFSLSLDELMAVHKFPKVGLYALIRKDGFVVQGQWLEDDYVDVIQELPDAYYAGAELLLARFDGLSFVPEIPEA